MAENVEWGQYLSDEQKHEIAVVEYRRAIQRALSTYNDVERFVGNVAYVAIQDLVDEALGEDARTVIAEKVATVIRNLSGYSVFRERNTLGKRSLAQTFLEDAVTDNKDLIRKRVRHIINRVDGDTVRYAIEEVIREFFTNVEKEK